MDFELTSNENTTTMEVDQEFSNNDHRAITFKLKLIAFQYKKVKKEKKVIYLISSMMSIIYPVMQGR